MGSIIFWGIIRLALTIAGIWILYYYMDYSLWWAFGIVALYGIVLHPAIIQYRLFEEENKEVIDFTLCSTCKHFDKSAVLCLKLDEHPTKKYLPCDGEAWEPKSYEDRYENKYEA